MSDDMQQDSSTPYSQATGPESPTSLTAMFSQHLATEELVGNEKIFLEHDTLRKVQKTAVKGFPLPKGTAKGADHSSTEDPQPRPTDLIVVSSRRLLVSAILRPDLSSRRLLASIEVAVQSLSQRSLAVNDTLSAVLGVDAREVAPSRRAIDNIIKYLGQLFHDDV